MKLKLFPALMLTALTFTACQKPPEFRYTELQLPESSAPIPLSKIAKFPLKTAINGSCYSRDGGILRKEDTYRTEDGVRVLHNKDSECAAG